MSFYFIVDMSEASAKSFLGVIGGMGPAATADFLAKLVRERGAGRDQDNVPVLVWGDCRIPDRSEGLRRATHEIGSRLAAAARLLSENGAAAIVMPCNTAHAWSSCIEGASSAPLLHIADAVMAHLEQAHSTRVALMATSGTLSAGIYQDRFKRASIDLMLPSQGEQIAIDDGIALAKAGQIDAARRALLPVVRALRDRGATMTVLACTELPLALGSAPDLIDSTQCLADFACRWWTENATLASAPGL